MEEYDSGGAIAALTDAAVVQAEVTHQRLALMWAQMVFDQLLEAWSHLEEHETLAYEDKVEVQGGLLRQASTNLWRFQRELARTCRLLKGHQRRLKRPEVLQGRPSPKL